MIEYVKYFYTD